MQYTSPPIGNNISWIFWNFSPKFFSNPSKLESILREGLKKDGLTPLNWHTHMFKGGGFTMLVPLSESHLSCHSYVEYGSLAFSLYSCLSPISGKYTYQNCLDKVNPKRYLLVQHLMPVDLHFLGDLELKIEKH